MTIANALAATGGILIVPTLITVVSGIVITDGRKSDEPVSRLLPVGILMVLTVFSLFISAVWVAAT